MIECRQDIMSWEGAHSRVSKASNYVRSLFVESWLMLPNSVHSVQIKLGNVNRLHRIGIMELVSASEAARIMDIPQTTLSRWIIGGRVTGAMKVANMWLVPADITIEDIKRPRMGRPRKKEEQQEE